MRYAEKIELANQRHVKMLSAVVNYDSPTSLPESVQTKMAHLATDRKNVLVLYYGGTLGMQPNEKGLLVPTDNAKELLNPLNERGLSKIMNIVWFPVWKKAIDSTNGRWPHWVTVGNAIRSLYDYFDGFVVAGGTDTMAHMVAAQRLIFPNTGKPIICTGAQRPMSYLGEDASRNLTFALKAACEDISGVHLAFADKLMTTFIHKIADHRFDAFTCANRYIAGDFDGEVHITNAPKKNEWVNKEELEFNPHFRDGVKVLQLSPMTLSESIAYELNDPYAHALVLVTHGAGNVRTEGVFEGEMTDLDAIKQLTEQQFPVILGSPMIDGKIESDYASGAAAISPEIGGISARDITGAALQVLAGRCLANSWGEKGKIVIATTQKDYRGPVGISLIEGLNYHIFRNQIAKDHFGVSTRR